MEPGDSMINPDEIRQFTKQVVENIARYGDMNYVRAEDRFRGSLVPDGLQEAPDYYLHETPYYWAMYILTGDRNCPQFPTDPHGAALSWAESQMCWEQRRYPFGPSAGAGRRSALS
jgi:hypothetical protein